MPIYAYKCASCGHAKDVLQKMSDAPLTQCPACGAQAFSKQVTAAGFQLKGSGWYATDFKGGGTSAPATDKAAEAAPSGDAKAGDAKPADSGSKPAEAKPAVTSSAPADSGSSGSK
ncbi:MAG: FmdB family zinc ribbon protein [Pseudomonadota bacterium]